MQSWSHPHLPTFKPVPPTARRPLFLDSQEPQVTLFHTVAASWLSFPPPIPLFSATCSLFVQKQGGIGGAPPSAGLSSAPVGQKSLSSGCYSLRWHGVVDGGDTGVFRQQVLPLLND